MIKDQTENINFLDEIANFAFTSKYAKYDNILNRRETWDETISRVENMHLKKFRRLSKEDKAEIKWAFSLAREKKVVPSMRSMQFAGKAIEAHESRIYNCCVLHVDSIRSFAEAEYLLLCGCGVGFGLSEKFLSRLPDLVSEEDKTGTVLTYVVQDNIEGWADSIEVLLSCYFRNTAMTGRKIVFDYSKIRPAGSILKTGGGKAPGYKGLKNCHIKIKQLLDHIIEDEGVKRIRPIHAYDILMHGADAVLSGGIRRSATCVVFDKSDSEMMESKTDFTVDKKLRFVREDNKWHGKVKINKKTYEVELSDWEYENQLSKNKISWIHIHPQRARSNNSVLLVRGQTTKEEFSSIINKTREYGEPGFVFGVEDSLYNPCFTIDTKVLTDQGWKTFESLVGQEPNIIQDKRVKGVLNSSKEEEWKISLNQAGTVINKASNVRKTGVNQEVYQITTTCGRQVKATKNHLFATPSGMKRTDEIYISAKILVAIPEAHVVQKDSNDYDCGFIAGLIYGDGCITKNGLIVDLWENNPESVNKIQSTIHKICVKDLKNQKTHKSLPSFTEVLKTDKYIKYRLSSSSLSRVLDEFGFAKDSLSWVHKNSKDFKSGFLSGLFYADGHVDYNKGSKSISLRITSVDFAALQDAQLVLQELGVFSRVNSLLPERTSSLPNGKGGVKDYLCKPSFRLIIAEKANCCVAAKILFNGETKKSIKFFNIAKSLSSVNKRYNQYAKVQKVEYIGKQDVYCLSEDVNRTLIAEGFTAKRCFEVSFIPVTKDKVCGVQFCNLSSINGAKVKTEEDFLKAVKAATIIGTLQASYTNFKYLRPASKQITEEESLLGVSITGMMDSPEICLDASIQKKGAELSIKINKQWAEVLGINPAARVTVVKPEGTSSLVLGAASGIHPHHARRYFRRIQCNKMDNVYRFFKSINPHACEESVWSANKTDDIAIFPLEINEKSIVKADLNAIKHLEIIKSTQKNWVITGTSDTNEKPIHHNVSCTVIVKDDEWEEVISYIYDNQDFFSAVSLLPFTGDKIYKQAPMEAVLTKEDEAKWAELIKSFKSVNYSDLEEGEDLTAHMQELSCAGGKCEI